MDAAKRRCSVTGLGAAHELAKFGSYGTNHAILAHNEYIITPDAQADKAGLCSSITIKNTEQKR